MESLGKYLSLVLAAGFSGSATFLYGRALALGHPELLWYLTFSDIVNYAPGTMLGYGAVLAAVVLNDRAWSRVQEHQKRTLPWNTRQRLFWYGIGVFLLAYGAVLLYFAWEFVILTAPVFLGLYLLSTRSKEPLRVAFGSVAALVFESYIAFIMGTFMLGASYGFHVDRSAASYSVLLGSGSIVRGQLLLIDRGVAVLHKNGFEFYPWSQIAKIAMAPATTPKK